MVASVGTAGGGECSSQYHDLISLSFETDMLLTRSVLLEKMRSRTLRSFRVGSSTNCSMKLDDMNSSRARPEFLYEARTLELGLMDLVDQSINRLKSPAMYT